MENRGGKNLFLLGLISVSIAILTSGISLLVYRSSGDIYLDRSRPGFLPEEFEKNDTKLDYTLSDSGGRLTDEELQSFLDSLIELKEKLNAIPGAFSSDSISDSALDIAE